MTVIHLGNTGPSVYQQPYVERQLTVLGWADSHVFGQIPADISGVIDGPATLEIWRSDGSKSSPLAVHFTAARDLEILPLVDTTLVSCEATADSNLCNQSSVSSQLSIPSKIVGLQSFSIFGEHTMFIPEKTDYQVSRNGQILIQPQEWLDIGRFLSIRERYMEQLRMLQRFSRRTLPELEAQLFDADQF